MIPKPQDLSLTDHRGLSAENLPAVGRNTCYPTRDGKPAHQYPQPDPFGSAPMSGLFLTLIREYDSSSGFWLSRDPMGEGADTNLYAYCLNNPIGNVDPLGLQVGLSIPELERDKNIKGLFFVSRDMANERMFEDPKTRQHEVTKLKFIEDYTDRVNEGLREQGISDKIQVVVFNSADHLRAMIDGIEPGRVVSVAAVTHGNFNGDVWLGDSREDITPEAVYVQMVAKASTRYPTLADSCQRKDDKTANILKGVNRIRNQLRQYNGK